MATQLLLAILEHTFFAAPAYLEFYISSGKYDLQFLNFPFFTILFVRPLHDVLPAGETWTYINARAVLPEIPSEKTSLARILKFSFQ